jgi:ceramide glucosyltransferase
MGFSLFALQTGLLLAASLYYLFTVYAAWRLFRYTAVPHCDSLPPVSIFKPLKGAPRDLYTNLASFCRLDYPAFQLLCGVQDPQDPAIAVVQRLQRDFPTCDIALVINPEVIGNNYKVNTLHHLSHVAKHELFVLTDSDVWVEPGYLRTVIRPLADPDVGLVTCPYRASTARPFPALLESLIINTSFTPSVFVASQFEATTYAFGATIAVKRQCLNAIGGFAMLSDYLADDYYLGHLVAQAGYRVQIVPYVVETQAEVATLAALLQHQLRWARTQRNCRPRGHFGTAATHGTVWALLGLWIFWSFPLIRILSLFTLGIRLLAAAVVSRTFLRTSLPLSTLLLVPVADMIYFLIWCFSLGGNTVRWREHTFRIQNNGKIVRVG